MSLWQQLRVGRALPLPPSVVLTLKPNEGKRTELFRLQMSLCHVLRVGKGAASTSICRMARAAMRVPTGRRGIPLGSHTARAAAARQAQRRCTGTVKGTRLRVFAGA